MKSIPPDVLKAFNCAGVPRLLHGGEGRSFLVGDAVFKPIRAEDNERYEWAGNLLSKLNGAGFRISVPLKTTAGRYVHAGWGATRYEPGEEIRGRWSEKLSACRAFHHALHALPISPMPFSANRWAQAHRIAWQDSELPSSIHPVARRTIAHIFQRYEPTERSTQVIHSDLCGNILFADGQAPLVIDFSPAYSAPEYAEAILVADAIAWERAPLDLISELPTTFDYRQMLLRAVNFRVITMALFHPTQPDVVRREFENFAPMLRRLG